MRTDRHSCYRCLQEASIPYRNKHGVSVVVCNECISTRDHAGLRDQQHTERYVEKQVYDV